MNGRRRGVAFGLATVLAFPAQAATIYLEDFAGQNGKGKFGLSQDVSGVDWSISAPDVVSGDYFGVVEERFEGVDTNTNAVWLSPVIATAGFSNLVLSLDLVEEGDLEGPGCACGINIDYLNLTAIFDGGASSQSFVDMNGLGDVASGFGLTGDVSSLGPDDADFGSTVFSAPLAQASSVQVRIDLRNSAAQEVWAFDNVTLTGDLTAVPAPLAGLLLLGGLGALRVLRRR